MNIGDPVVLKVVPTKHHLNNDGLPWKKDVPMPQPGDVGEVSYVTINPDFGCVTFPSGAGLSCVTFSTDCYEFFEGLCYRALNSNPTPEGLSTAHGDVG